MKISGNSPIAEINHYMKAKVRELLPKVKTFAEALDGAVLSM